MRKLIICVALAGLLAALCCAAGLAATYGDFTYEVMEDGNVRVTAYNGTSATVVIPGSINGRTVTRVEHYDPESGEVWSLFEGNEDVVSITFPDTVETIHSYGFGWCVSLKEIHLPASIKHIPYNAFSGCRSLTSIVIPEGVVSVEGSAFRGCSKLTKMWLPASLTMFPPDEDWLYYPDEEEDYEYPAGYHLTIYGYRGTIVEKMFSDPDEHVTFVARDEDIRTSGGYSYLPVDGGCVIVDYSGTASSLTIPSSLGGLTVVGIRGGAFAWNSKIVNVVIPGTVKTIGSGAFESCPELTSVQIKEGVQSIGAHAFAECESLETVYMPSSVTAIARDPFYESAISYSEDGVIVPRNSYAAK